jgi:preprotein translocase subunit SecD
MSLRSGTLLLVLALLAFTFGCSKSADAPVLSTDSQLKEFLDACPLSIHPVDSSGKASSFSIVRSEHVKAFGAGRVHIEGELAVMIYLNAEGDRRMLRYTTENVGKSLSVQCDGDETSRPTILEPFSSPFRLGFPESTDPN